MYPLQFSTKLGNSNTYRNNVPSVSQRIVPLSSTYIVKNDTSINSSLQAQSLRPSTIDSNIKNNAKPKTMLWGEPIWFLFHTLAQKVKEDAFPEIRKELFQVIITICDNLPCPDCANHAMQYMKGINFHVIQTKKDLIDMLFQFHNSVNARKGYPAFLYADLESKYTLANTIPIIQNFMKHFNKPNYSGRVGVNNFHKSRAVSYLTTWFSNNIKYFDP